jgi:lysine 2,3-aminomutase
VNQSSDIENVIARFPFVACAYARSLADASDAFRRQVEPDVRELDDAEDFGPDPFDEEGEASGCFGLKQRFPDRVLVMTSNACFMNCRHCTRKGLLRHAEVVRSDEELAACAAYVQEHPLVRDVLLSGGDPLVLPDAEVMRFVRTADTALLLTALKPEGSRMMDGGAFLRGRPLKPLSDMFLAK